jgi:tetratricopeptide (TPR) repeat protein
MKLGEVFFDRGSFADAETQFATLARDFPDSAYAETALFLAGQAAMQSINPEAVDRALQLFDQVIKRDRSLKLHARQQQAIVQTRLGRESEAIKLYDLILAAQPPPVADLRYRALCAKGDNLLALGKTDREQRTAALAVYRELAALPDVPAVWRNQALYKTARQLAEDWRRLRGAPGTAAQADVAFQEATVTFYDVLNVDSRKEREFFWYYKAGFDAAQLFEEQAARSGATAGESEAHWRAAIGIYRKMAQLEGPRSAEAQSRMRQLQLQHFIWD